MNQVLPFYDGMAAPYHSIFDDWEAAIRRQGTPALNGRAREAMIYALDLGP
jgi:hypothetical protein